MRICQSVQQLRYLLPLLVIAPGCLQIARPEMVEVRDAETNKPIPGANVRISYPLENALLAPSESKGVTGTDGVAQLRAAPYGRAGVMVEVTAKGYMNEQKVLTIEEVQAVEPAHWFEDVSRRSASLIMQMYAKPPATVELIVAPGYHGQVKVKMEVKPEAGNSVSPPQGPPAGFEPGQRLFIFAVPPSGEVIAAGPSLFRHVSPGNLHVKYADDFPISRHAKDTSIGYWWLKCENNWHYLFVGTETEYVSYHPPARTNDGQDKKSSGGGQGRHGRKGSQLPADPAGP